MAAVPASPFSVVFGSAVPMVSSVPCPVAGLSVAEIVFEEAEWLANSNSWEADPLFFSKKLVVTTKWLNRGRTVGGSFVYWESKDRVDASGTYYPYAIPPWSDIVEVVGIRKWQEAV